MVSAISRKITEWAFVQVEGGYLVLLGGLNYKAFCSQIVEIFILQKFPKKDFFVSYQKMFLN